MDQLRPVQARLAAQSSAGVCLGSRTGCSFAEESVFMPQTSPDSKPGVYQDLTGSYLTAETPAGSWGAHLWEAQTHLFVNLPADLGRALPLPGPLPFVAGVGWGGRAAVPTLPLLTAQAGITRFPFQQMHSERGGDS